MPLALFIENLNLFKTKLAKLQVTTGISAKITPQLLDALKTLIGTISTHKRNDSDIKKDLQQLFPMLDEKDIDIIYTAELDAFVRVCNPPEARITKYLNAIINTAQAHLSTQQLAKTKTSVFGYKKQEVPHDGDCFFSAMIRQLQCAPKKTKQALLTRCQEILNVPAGKPIEINSNLLRKIACQELENNQQQYLAQIPDYDGDPQQVTKYIDRQRKSSIWADEATVQALVNTLRIPLLCINLTEPERGGIRGVFPADYSKPCDHTQASPLLVDESVHDAIIIGRIVEKIFFHDTEHFIGLLAPVSDEAQEIFSEIKYLLALAKQLAFYNDNRAQDAIENCVLNILKLDKILAASSPNDSLYFILSEYLNNLNSLLNKISDTFYHQLIQANVAQDSPLYPALQRLMSQETIATTTNAAASTATLVVPKIFHQPTTTETTTTLVETSGAKDATFTPCFDHPLRK